MEAPGVVSHGGWSFVMEGRLQGLLARGLLSDAASRDCQQAGQGQQTEARPGWYEAATKRVSCTLSQCRTPTMC